MRLGRGLPAIDATEDELLALRDAVLVARLRRENSPKHFPRPMTPTDVWNSRATPGARRYAPASFTGESGFYGRARPSWKSRGIDRSVCVYCGGRATHGDHVMPRRLGGPDVFWNILPACAACNTSKGATPVREWLQRRTASGRVLVFSDALATWLRWDAQGLVPQPISQSAL